jgi:putative spermidine/putrescine transport system permease protein
MSTPSAVISDAEPDLTLGAATRPRGSPWQPVLLLAPAGLLIGLLAGCSLAILRLSLSDRHAEWVTWSAAAYAALLDRYYLFIIADTIWLALLSAVITTVISFPIALYMTRTPSALARRAVLIAVMLPMVVS